MGKKGGTPRRTGGKSAPGSTTPDTLARLASKLETRPVEGRSLERFAQGYQPDRGSAIRTRARGFDYYAKGALGTQNLVPPELNSLVLSRLMNRAQREANSTPGLRDDSMLRHLLDEYMAVHGALLDENGLFVRSVRASVNQLREAVPVRIADLGDTWRTVGKKPTQARLRLTGEGLYVGRSPRRPVSVTAYWRQPEGGGFEQVGALPEDCSEGAFVLPKSGTPPLWRGYPIRLIVDFPRGASLALDLLP